MTKHRRLPLTALIATLAALALPGAASADTYCVNESPCLFGTAEPTIQSALDAVAQHPGADTVRIGPASVPYNEGPLVYLEPASNSVRIVGAGASDTVVTSTNAGLDLLTLGPASTVEGLRIAVVPGVSNAGGLRLVGASASSVSVTYQGDEQNAVGIRTEGDAELEDVRVSMKTGFGVYAGVAPHAATLLDSEVSARRAIVAGNGADLRVLRSHLVGSGSGGGVGSVRASGGGTRVTLENTLVQTTGADSLAVESAWGAELSAENVTVVATGASEGTGTGARVYSTSPTASLNLRNSIVEGYETSIHCNADGAGNSSALEVRYSSFDADTASTQPADGCTPTLGPGNIDHSPQFVDPNPIGPLEPPDFRLLPSSPLIDAGQLGWTAGPDLDGNPRVVDGDGEGSSPTPDIGAYEYQRREPTAALSGPDSATAGTPVELSAVGSSDPDAGDVLGYSWSFGDGASASGKTVSHAFAAAGTRQVTLTVTDPTGLKDTATKAIAVAGEAIAVGGGTGSTTGGGSGTGGSGPGTDAAAPVLSDVAVRPRRLRPGSRLPRLIARARHGGTIRFRLSEPARVRVRFARARAGGRFVRARGSLRLQAPAGLSRVRFQGRISHRRSLPPGRYRLTIVAVDAAGNRAARRRARFTVLAGKP
jgi:hypothetical protein